MPDNVINQQVMTQQKSSQQVIMQQKITQQVTTLSALLTSKNQLLTAAESCTGGAIAYFCTSQAGSSSWFAGSFVTYSNAMKSSILDVPETLLDTYGAVSEATVKHMLLGSLKHIKADISIAISGIAGPSGATPEKPVGMVCFAYGTKNNHRTCTLYFEGNREEVRTQATQSGLDLVINYLNE